MIYFCYNDMYLNQGHQNLYIVSGQHEIKYNHCLARKRGFIDELAVENAIFE